MYLAPISYTVFALTEMKIELIQWIYVAIIAPLFGAAGAWLHAIIRTRRSRKQFVEYLSGHPSESKAVMVEFITAEKHTMRGDPLNPPVRILLSHGILFRGPDGGTQDAVDSYLSVTSKYWAARNNWLLTDPKAMQLYNDHIIANQAESSRT